MNATASLFKNNYKQADNHPDFKGNGKDADGNEFDIAAWVKKDKNQNSYFSIKISPKREQSAPRPATAPTPAAKPIASITDDLPF